MTGHPIAAIVYSDGVYPDRAMAAAIAPLEELGVPLAGALQVPAGHVEGRHPCDMLLKDLATGNVCAIAEERGPRLQEVLQDAAEGGCRAHESPERRTIRVVIADLLPAPMRLTEQRAIDEERREQADRGPSLQIA